MAWIKMRNSLWNHPKVHRIAKRLAIPKATAIGALHGAWCIADEHADGERVDLMTTDLIDDFVGIDGFAEAMEHVGWINVRDDGVEFVDYEQHNGTTAKQRAQSQKRMKRHREEGRPRTVAKAEGRRAEKPTAKPRVETVPATSEPDLPDVSNDPRRWPNHWLEEIRQQYPEEKQGGPVGDYREIREALSRIEAKHGEPYEAVAWLRARVEAFAKSPLGRSRYANSLQRWMREGDYDQPPKAWQKGEGKGDGPPPSAAYQREPTDEERRIQAKRKAAMERRKNKGSEGK